MAHNININPITGKASFFTVKEPAWHGLGKILENCPTSEEAIVHAGMDFVVEKRPLYAFADETEESSCRVPDRFGTMRMDTHDILGVVSSRYQVIQNKQAFTFFDAIVGEGQAIYETAGVLGKGEIIFITAKLPGHIQVLSHGTKVQDMIDKYLLLTMSHDGKQSITAMFTPIRVVCNNTLTAALEQATNKVFVRHTSNAEYNLKQAHTILGIASRLSDSLTEIFGAMALYKLTEDQVKDYIIKVFQLEAEMTTEGEADKDHKITDHEQKVIDTVWTYYHTGAGQDIHLGTLFGAYNAITGYLQNVKGYRTTSSKMANLYMGEGEKTALLAFKIALNILKQK